MAVYGRVNTPAPARAVPRCPAAVLPGDGRRTAQKAECTVPGIQFFHQGAGQGEDSFFLRQDFRNGRAAGLLDKVRELNLQGKGVSPEAGTGQPPREFFRQQGEALFQRFRPGDVSR